MKKPKRQHRRDERSVLVKIVDFDGKRQSVRLFDGDVFVGDSVVRMDFNGTKMEQRASMEVSWQ